LFGASTAINLRDDGEVDFYGQGNTDQQSIDSDSNT